MSDWESDDDKLTDVRAHRHYEQERVCKDTLR